MTASGVLSKRSVEPHSNNHLFTGYVFCARFGGDSNANGSTYYYQSIPFFETAKMLYVPAALLDYKFSLLHKKGQLVNPMYIKKANFLKEDLGDYDPRNEIEYD